MRRSDSSNDHLYNNDWCKNPSHTISYDIEVYPGQWTTDYITEGQYHLLIDRHNNVYTHHPIEVIRKIYDHPQFKHLSLSQITKAVEYTSECRQSAVQQDPWREGDRFRYDRFQNLQADPFTTTLRVAQQLGLSCRCCTNMIWNGRVDKSIEKIDMDQFWSEDYDYEGYEKTEKRERIFTTLFSEGNYRLGLRLRPFCDSCLKIAERGIRPYRDKMLGLGRNDEVIALRGVLHLYKSFIPKREKKGKPKCSTF